LPSTHPSSAVSGTHYIYTLDRAETCDVNFMAVIDGVFCLEARVIFKAETLSVRTLEWSETIGNYNNMGSLFRRSTID